MCAHYHDEIPGVDKRDISHEVLPGQQTLHINMQLLPQDHQPLLTPIQTEVQHSIKTQEGLFYNIVQLLLT